MLKDKSIGIIGGIGPESSGILYLELIKKIQKEFYLESTEDYPQIILNSIAMRDLIYKNVTESDMKPILRGLKQLDQYSPNCNAIICNSAYSFFDYLSSESATPLIDLKSIVHEFLISNNIKNVGVLATDISIQKVYKYNDINALTTSKKNHEITNRLITNFNKGKKQSNDESELSSIINELLDKGAEKIILGCTELELIGRGFENTIHPMDLLIDDIIGRLRA